MSLLQPAAHEPRFAGCPACWSGSDVPYALNCSTCRDLSDVARTSLANFQGCDRVFLLIYSPDCGHCRAMKPQFVKFASVAQERGIGVAMVNGWKNKAVYKDANCQGVPSGYVILRSSKEVVPVSMGKRTVADMLASCDVESSVESLGSRTRNLAV